ncbi:hypothetical protein MPSEU_000818800 [Mayamaea pseudoterrestris]|nr:hypothetical protein MPSEU_000818800 [Mayamaea pseudoterrestris]
MIHPRITAATAAASPLYQARSCLRVNQDGLIQHRGAPSGYIRSITSGKIQQPNRFTKYFQQLKVTCPDEIKAYADCVNYHAHHASSQDDKTADDDGSMLRKGSCQDEFDKIKACWETLRRNDLQTFRK